MQDRVLQGAAGLSQSHPVIPTPPPHREPSGNLRAAGSAENRNHPPRSIPPQPEAPLAPQTRPVLQTPLLPAARHRTHDPPLHRRRPRRRTGLREAREPGHRADHARPRPFPGRRPSARQGAGKSWLTRRPAAPDASSHDLQRPRTWTAPDDKRIFDLIESVRGWRLGTDRGCGNRCLTCACSVNLRRQPAERGSVDREHGAARPGTSRRGGARRTPGHNTCGYEIIGSGRRAAESGNCHPERGEVA